MKDPEVVSNKSFCWNNRSHNLLFRKKISSIKITFLFCLMFTPSGLSQTYDPFIEQLMNETSIDSLVKITRILSGEDSVLVGDSIYLIAHRMNSAGNDLAAEFIKQQLTYYELEVYDEVYSPGGRNIYAVQWGKTYPEQYFIYCAHYDAVTYYCADDNASGSAGVLEAARILSKHTPEYSIIYAFWDEEELGLIGSRSFAASAFSNNMDIKGVINFEMSGWDSDDDGLMDIHTRPIGNSVLLAEIFMNVNSIYNLPLNPVIYNPGTGASDHSAFWFYDYSAICISEAYWGGDFNPYYHSAQDRIDKFNLNYFHNIARLGIASISTLAFENVILSVKDPAAHPTTFSIYNYPNPFNSSTVIRYNIAEEMHITLELYSITGERIKILYSGSRSAGTYEQILEGEAITSGTYFVALRSDNNIILHKVMLLK